MRESAQYSRRSKHGPFGRGDSDAYAASTNYTSAGADTATVEVPPTAKQREDAEGDHRIGGTDDRITVIGQFRIEICLQFACILLAGLAARVRLSRSVDPRYGAGEMRRLRPTGPLPQVHVHCTIGARFGGGACLHFSSRFHVFGGDWVEDARVVLVYGATVVQSSVHEVRSHRSGDGL